MFFSLGDNPSCSSGPPLTISWEPESTHAYPLEKYETHREGSRRGRYEMIVPSSVRMDMLQNAGHSYSEIIRCTQEVMKTKKSIMKTKDKKESVHKMEEQVEKTRRTFGKLLHRKRTKANKEFIRNALEHDKISKESTKNLTF